VSTNSGVFYTTYSLAEGTALTDCDLVTIFDTESWADVCGQVLVSLLVTGVFWDEMEVFAANDEGSVHLGGNNSSGQDTATDGDETGEWALLVCECAVSDYATILNLENDDVAATVDFCPTLSACACDKN
jgi:hypothetical protein